MTQLDLPDPRAEQPRQLGRVSTGIAATVLEFCRMVEGRGQFGME